MPIGLERKITNQFKIKNQKLPHAPCPMPYAHSVTIDLADISHHVGYLCLSH
jgi:hypothetical protein